jgi:formylglycine-generating enzyme required for sulfatase activity
MKRSIFLGLVIASLLGGWLAAQEPPSGMALVPAGEFWQGRVYRTLIEELDMIARARIDDVPAHLVYLDAFYIDKYEASNADYAKFVEATGHAKPYFWIGGQVPAGKEKWPVYDVSWDDATAYCSWAEKRLPTESEWEKAARGGTDKLRFPWGDALLMPPARGRGAAPVASAAPPSKDDPGGTSALAQAVSAAPPSKDDPGGTSALAQPPAANTEPARGRGTPPPTQAGGGRRGGGVGTKMAHYGVSDGPLQVGSFPPNAFGIYDMVGNVGEWVQDWYDPNYYAVSPDRNPKGPKTGRYRVWRGDTWAATDERNLAVNYRQFDWQSDRTVTVGFRCAKSLPGAPPAPR